MVSNDMASAPALRAAYSISAATSVSRTPGRMTSSARSKRLAPRSTADRRQAISSSSFTMRACSTRAGASRRRKPEGRIRGEARPGRHRHVLALNPNLRGSSTAFLLVRRQPGGGCRQRPLASDHDLRRPHFGPRLLGVAPIGDEDALLFGEKKGAGAAGESAEIAKVGRMSDQQSVQAMGGKRILQTLLPALVVHPRSLARQATRRKFGSSWRSVRLQRCQQTSDTCPASSSASTVVPQERNRRGLRSAEPGRLATWHG